MKEERNFIFGTRAIIEAIKAGKEVDKIFVQQGLTNPLIQELRTLAYSYKLPIKTVPVEKLNRLTKKNHQGVICYLSAINFSDLDNVLSSCYEKGKDPFLLILDRITDVRNFGAICRSAECAGVDAVIVPGKGSAALNNDAVKTSAGALHHLPVCRVSSLASTVRFVQNSGLRVVACTEKSQDSLFDSELTGPLAVVLGSEEDGISQEVLSAVNERYAIPMMGKIESLNVSVSAGIILFEAIRQRK